MDAERLCDLYEIERLKSRYFRFHDTRQWDAWRELFTDDFEVFVEDTPLPTATEPFIVGAQRWVEFNRESKKGDSITIHHGHMPDIEFLDDHHATGIWAMFDWVDVPDRATGMQGFGHYYETYEKGDDGRWRIATMRLTRLRENRVDHLPSQANEWLDLQRRNERLDGTGDGNSAAP